MTTLLVVGGADDSVVITGLADLGATYELRLLQPTGPHDLPAGGVDGHLVLADSIPDEVAREIAGWPAGRVHGLVLLAGSGTPTLPPYLPALAGWGVPTLVVAPADGERRAAGQLLSAGVPDAVFVVTEEGPAEPQATTVHWVASFLSIVDGLRDARSPEVIEQ